jgi:predicted enzyme related to lactoylglutathione lyase
MAQGKRPVATKVIASLGVSDIERSIEFYTQFFGFQVADSYEQDGGRVWCWLQTASADLMLQQLSPDQQIKLDPAIGQSWMLYIRPDDIDDAHHDLRVAGCEVSEMRTSSYATREFFAKDPDGYELWVSMPLDEYEE